MITDKRTRKPPEKFEDTVRKLPRKERHIEKKLKVNRCNYELIPVPQKYKDFENMFLTYGNIPCHMKDDKLDCNIAILNEFHLYKGVHTAEIEGQRMTVVKAERRADRRFPRWKTVYKKLRQGGEYAQHVADAVQSYSENIELLTSDYINKISALSVQKGGKGKIAEFKAVIDDKKRELALTYPYFQCRSSFRGSQTELDEIIVNEKLLQILGYTPELFASTVLSEGLPPFLALRLGNESETSPYQCQYGPQQKRLCPKKAPEMFLTLYTRSNYVQPVNVQIYIIVNHDESEYKCDVVYVVKDHNYPLTLPPIYKGNIFTKDYINFMLERERQMEEFLKYLKNDAGFIRFSGHLKTCKIKELKPPKEEQEEEESASALSTSSISLSQNSSNFSILYNPFVFNNL